MDATKTRGGARRHPVPPVEDSLLLGLLGKHAEEICDLGVYESIQTPQAVNGEGLAAKAELLTVILEAVPTAELPMASCKQAFTRVLSSKPVLNNTVFQNHVFAGLRMDRLACMLHHVRRLCQDEYKRDVCAAKCSGPSWAKVQDLMAMVQLANSPRLADSQASEGACSSASASTGSAPSKVLKRKVTLDDDGFPKLFDFEESQGGASSAADSSANLIPAARAPAGQGRAAKAAQAAATSKGLAAPTEASEDAAEAVEAAESAAENKKEKKDWELVYYKKYNSVGVRRKFAKKEQIFSFKSETLSRDALEKHGKRAIVKLLSGKSEQYVAEWAKSNIPDSA
jgi:hypothetical protein